MSPLSPTNRRRLATSARRAQAVELRCAGLTFTAIAERLGINRSNAHRLITEALLEHAKTIAEHADELRALESRRLDEAAQALWERVKQGDARAQDTWLRNRARLASLLGLDLRPPDQVIDASQHVIVLPAWGEQPSTVDSEARELGLGTGAGSDDERHD